MGTIRWEMLPYVDPCLIIQAFFLNFLWIILFWGWIVGSRKYPSDTLSGGTPDVFQWVIAVTVWALTFGISLYEFPPIYWFLGFAIANGAFLSVINPPCALCFSMSMLLVRPWELMPHNGMILEIPRFSMFFSIGWAFFYYFVVDRFSFRANRVVFILLAFLSWMLISTFFTPDPAEARQEFNDTLVRSFTIFFLIYHLARDRYAIWALRVSLVTIFSCVGLISLFFYFSGYREGGRIIAFGLFANSNDIASIMGLLFPLAASAFLKKSPWLVEKSLALIPISISLAVIVFSQSRGALLSVVASVGTFAYMKMRKKTTQASARSSRNRSIFVVLVLLVLMSGLVAKTVLNRNAGDLQGSTESRKSFWISGLRMAMYNPVFGVGMGQFPANFESYASRITGEYGKRTAHSSWILALGEGGPIALLLFIALYVFGTIVPGVSIFKEEPEWLCSAVCYGIAMSFLSHTYSVWPYILIATITVASQVTKDIRAKQINIETEPLWIR